MGSNDIEHGNGHGRGEAHPLEVARRAIREELSSSPGDGLDDPWFIDEPAVAEDESPFELWVDVVELGPPSPRAVRSTASLAAVDLL